MDLAIILIAAAGVVLAVTMFHKRMQARRLERLLRKRDLDALIDMGWRVELETDEHTYLVNGRRVNHILHLLLTVFTAGLWGIVWIVLALNGGEKRRTLRK